MLLLPWLNTHAMGVPFFDIQRHLEPLKADLLQALKAVLDDGDFILGQAVADLEKAIAKIVGTTGAVGVSSGTDALLVAMMALGIGPGDEVVTTPFTFFATAGAAARLGATLRFADIEEDTFNLDPNHALALVSVNTKAIVPVHLFGHMASMKPCLEWASKADRAVIEDAAQAIGASCPLGMAGSLGSCGIFSFFPSKNLGGIGDGGMITSSDPALLDKVQLLRNHGARPKYHHLAIGGNFRLDTVQAAALLKMLPYLEQWTKARRELARSYTTLFEQSGLIQKGFIRLPTERHGYRHVYNQYVVRTERRDELAKWLQAHGIGFAIYYPEPLHLQPCFAHLGYREGSLPKAEKACKEVIALPIFPELKLSEQEEVVGRIADFYSSL